MRRTGRDGSVMAARPLEAAANTLARRATPYLLLAPAMSLLGVFFFYPLLSLFVATFYTQASPGGPLRGPGLANYLRFLSDPFYLFVLRRTKPKAVIFSGASGICRSWTATLA